MSKQKVAKICAAVFTAATIISTLHAAAIDAGIIINKGPLPGSENYMGFGEAVLFNIPVGIPDGVLAAAVVAFGMGIYRLVQEIRQDIEKEEAASQL